MKRLFVAGQDPETREWIPVAELRQTSEGFELRYTTGATRLKGFNGLSRMQSLEKVYYSRTLFPFFSNRLVARSRPEFRDYLRWLDLDSEPSTPLEMLSITGGLRATDSYELFAPPEPCGAEIALKFFPRGLRYQSAAMLEQLLQQTTGAQLFAMKDVQNPHDPSAIALRTERPHAMLVGYVPRYYCLGLHRLLDTPNTRVNVQVKRVNRDAPLDMKLLVSITATVPSGFSVIDNVKDFLPVTSEAAAASSDSLLALDLDPASPSSISSGPV
jgi:hypothetical protein